MPWHPTGLAADTSAGSATRPVAIGGTAMLVIPWDGGWYAIEDRCSHAGCAFSEDGEIDGPHVVCDCHGSEFDIRTGAVVRSPATEPIGTFPVRVQDGHLEVER